MTNKKHNKGKGAVSPVFAGVTGAIVGAGVAVAAVGAIALKDEKNREKVIEALTNVKNQAVGYMDDMQKQAQEKKNEVEEKLTEDKEKVKKVTDSAKGALRNELKDAKKTMQTK